MGNFPAGFLLRLLKGVLALLVMLLVATLLLELGFGARDWIESRSQRQSIHSGKTRILFIGDSILGFVNQNYSLSAHIVEKLNQQFPGSFEFREISAPALRTAEIVKSLKKTMDAFRPHGVIFMAGKSDDVVPGLGHWDYLFNLRIVRLLFAAYIDLKQQWLKWTDQKTFLAKTQLRSAWDYLAQNDCAKAIPFFEKSIPRLMHEETRDRIYRGLHYCYIQEKKYSEAIDFFSTIHDVDSYQELLDGFLRIHRDLEGAGNKARKGGDLIVSLSKTGKKLSRDQVRTNMWFYWSRNQQDEFFLEYKNMDASASDKLKEKSIQNTQYIIYEIESYLSTIFILQYPMDYVSALEISLGPEKKHVIYLDLRSKLLQAPKNEFIKMWSSDMEHLSSQGAEFLAQKISPILLEALKK